MPKMLDNVIEETTQVALHKSKNTPWFIYNKFCVELINDI